MSSKNNNLDARQNILKINLEQKRFYNQQNEERRYSIATRAWRIARRRMYGLLREASIWRDIFDLQKEWIGDLSNQKVLDFGCYQGNALSVYLASNSRKYVGIDLSEEPLKRLAELFDKKGIKNYDLHATDILAESFSEDGFDLIYAQGVLHHFNPISALLPVLRGKLTESGKIVSVDPLQTSVLTGIVRGAYHPFRYDKEWEWPFTRRTIAEIEQSFAIKHVQGFLGRSKYAIPCAFLGDSFGRRVAKRLHSRDMQDASRKGPALWSCLQVAMYLEKK